LIQQGRFRTVKTEQGFTKARVAGVEKTPRTDFLAVFEEAIGDQQWYLNLQPELENTRQLVFSKEYLEKGGNLAMNFWKDYIDVVARRGWSATAKSSYFLRKGRLNLNDAVLGYKASTIMLQPFALFDAMAYAQTRYGTKATMEVAKEFTKAWLVPGVAKRTIAESAALRARMGGEVAIQESLERVAKSKGMANGLTNVYNRFRRGAMKAIQFADVRTAVGAQNGILNILEKNGVPNAKQEAEFLMNIMQGSAEVTYRPLILSKGEGARTWFTFQTFMLNRWGIVAHDIIRSGFSGNWKAKLNATLGLGILIAGAIAENEARSALSETITGKEQKGRSALMTALMFIPEQVPYFGNILQGLTQYGDASGAPPVVRIVEDTFTGGYQAITAKKPETRARGAIQFGKGVAGLGFGVPGTFQIADAVKRFFQTETKKGIKGMPELPKLPALPKLPQLPALPEF